MKYSLSYNAISSLCISIDQFKILYYHQDEYSQSQLDEAAKICIVFLENAIELLLKTILVSEEPLAIYKEPNSRGIRKALTKTTDTTKLEDILISEKCFQTIGYAETVERYNKKYHNSEKVYMVLKELGETRNAITHFGIDTVEQKIDFNALLINVFDVIYNYLYPQLVHLDEIGEYFTSDGLIVTTLHGPKPLFDDEFIYNNIIDFLDEVMESGTTEICVQRARDENSNLNRFIKLLSETTSDAKFAKMQKDKNIEVVYSDHFFDEGYCDFSIMKNDEEIDSFFSIYSVFHNATVLGGETGNVYFIVVHDENKVYIYDDDCYVNYPSIDEPEKDHQWIEDCQAGYCKAYNLSKRNLLLAFKHIFDCLDEK